MRIDTVVSENTFHFLPYIMTSEALMSSSEEPHRIIMIGWMFFALVVFL